jgi:hypothetical protein
LKSGAKKLDNPQPNQNMSEENQPQPVVSHPTPPPAGAPIDMAALLQSGVEIMRQITVEPERVKAEFELKKVQLETASQNRIFFGLFIIIGLVVIIAGYMAIEDNLMIAVASSFWFLHFLVAWD